MTMLDTHAEQAISIYLDWLNLWHEAQDEPECRVTRANCDEWDDAPKLLNDWQQAGMRTMTIYVSPYHDEGGPTILTVWLTNYEEPANWTIDAIDQCFDTMHQYIYNDGSLTNTPEKD